MNESFLAVEPRIEDYWRAIILFGLNVASYKFSLANALLELKASSGQLIKLEELAGPFSRNLCDHLRTAEKQGTFSNSKFLDACRKFNAGELTNEKLIEHTLRYGFNNVIDAFHVIGRDPIPRRFFIDERRGNNGVRITDEFSELLSGSQAGNLSGEAEARWRLVERAWTLGLSRNLLSVSYDLATETLFTFDSQHRRKSVTGSRGALNGYQKGKCFYCFCDLQLNGFDRSDVDHFFPHRLKPHNIGPAIDGIWNLVLTCQKCNRGEKGKWDRIPSLRLLERLFRRNEFLIGSHHPLRETLMSQTGTVVQARRLLLNDFYRRAKTMLIHEWEGVEICTPPF